MKRKNKKLITQLKYSITVLISFFVAAFIGAYTGSKWYDSFVEYSKFIAHNYWILSAIFACLLLALYPYLLSCFRRRHSKTKDKVDTLIPLHYDNPTYEDDFERMDFAKMLAKKIGI